MESNLWVLALPTGFEGVKTPHLVMRTTCAWRVGLGARGLAAKRTLLRGESTLGFAPGTLRVGLPWSTGAWRGKHTLSSISLWTSRTPCPGSAATSDVVRLKGLDG
jgi:hypothetical protein